MTTVDAPWFLAGNFGPVQEERTDLDLAVTGAIPPALEGRYLRNGSNPRDGAAGHWFFGDGMVHGIRLAGGTGRLVPQPLRAHDEVRGAARRDRTGDDDGSDRERGEHARARPRRPDLGARGGPPPVRAHAGARHHRVRRLRRPADDGVHGPSEAVPRHGRAALLRLRRAAAVPHVPRARRRRRARALGADHRARPDDDARLHDHAGPRRVHGPARRVRPRRGDARRGPAALGRVLRRARRDAAALRHRCRHPVVRRRPVLRVPPAERVRRRLARRVRRRAPRVDVADVDGRLPAVVPAPLDVRPRHRGGDRGAARRRVPRVPARRRPRRRPAPPLRLGDRPAQRPPRGDRRRRGRRQVRPRDRIERALRPRPARPPG